MRLSAIAPSPSLKPDPSASVNLARQRPFTWQRYAPLKKRNRLVSQLWATHWVRPDTQDFCSLLIGPKGSDKFGVNQDMRDFVPTLSGLFAIAFLRSGGHD